jgi:tripartite-type tricarboxylate transporter receptor subunit TctC
MWGQQMVIENRPGAGGNIAALAVLNSEPDGYTVYICSIGHAINQFIYPSIGYNPVTDFAPVTLMCVYPNIMAVPNSSPDRSVPDFIARAKADPGKVTYCSSGVGTSLHLAGELFKRLAGVDLTHIPYRGAGPGAQRSHPRAASTRSSLTFHRPCRWCSRARCAGLR